MSSVKNTSQGPSLAESGLRVRLKSGAVIPIKDYLSGKTYSEPTAKEKANIDKLLKKSSKKKTSAPVSVPEKTYSEITPKEQETLKQLTKTGKIEAKLETGLTQEEKEAAKTSAFDPGQPLGYIGETSRNVAKATSPEALKGKTPLERASLVPAKIGEWGLGLAEGAGRLVETFTKPTTYKEAYNFATLLTPEERRTLVVGAATSYAKGMYEEATTRPGDFIGELAVGFAVGGAAGKVAGGAGKLLKVGSKTPTYEVTQLTSLERGVGVKGILETGAKAQEPVITASRLVKPGNLKVTEFSPRELIKPSELVKKTSQTRAFTSEGKLIGKSTVSEYESLTPKLTKFKTTEKPTIPKAVELREVGTAYEDIVGTTGKEAFRESRARTLFKPFEKEEAARVQKQFKPPTQKELNKLYKTKYGKERTPSLKIYDEGKPLPAVPKERPITSGRSMLKVAERRVRSRPRVRPVAVAVRELRSQPGISGAVLRSVPASALAITQRQYPRLIPAFKPKQIQGPWSKQETITGSDTETGQRNFLRRLSKARRAQKIASAQRQKLTQRQLAIQAYRSASPTKTPKKPRFVLPAFEPTSRKTKTKRPSFNIGKPSRGLVGAPKRLTFSGKSASGITDVFFSAGQKKVRKSAGVWGWSKKKGRRSLI